MYGVRSFFQALGMFWAITLIVAVMGGLVFVGGWKLNWWLASHTVQQQYQVNQQSQQYQQTYLQQTDKAYEQLAIDKYDIEQAKSSGDSTAEQDAYAAASSDLKSFCTYAQQLVPASRTTLGPQELGLYTSSC